MSNKIELLADTCRLCLKQDETVCNELETVLEMVKAIAQIEIPLEDGLPSSVCSDCVQRLEIANDMRAVCLRSLDYFNKVDDSKLILDDQIDESSELDLSQDEYEVSVIDCLRCCICASLFDQTDELSDHCRNDHDRGLVFSPDDFWCSVCAIDWETRDSLQLHRTCEKCLVVFLDTQDLERHVIDEHTEIKQEESEYEEEIEEYLIESTDMESATSIRGTKLQGCCRCAEQFKKADDLIAHFKNQHSDHIHKGDRGKYNCKWCKIPFEHKGDLQRHYKSPRVKTYSCNECNTFFGTFTKLRMHMEQVHGGFQIYQCDECDKTYEQLNSLRYHKYTMHNEKNRYKCPDCGKLFTRRNMYNEHRNIHLGLKPFKCKDCGASFASNSSLRSHFR